MEQNKKKASKPMGLILKFLHGPKSPKPWILPPLSNSWIIIIIWLYIAFNRTPNIDCYWVGAVPNLNLGKYGAALYELRSRRVFSINRLCSVTVLGFWLLRTVSLGDKNSGLSAFEGLHFLGGCS